MSTLYEHKGQWLTLEQFRKVRGIGQSIEPEKEVIEITSEKIEIVEPEINLEKENMACKPKKSKKK